MRIPEARGAASSSLFAVFDGTDASAGGRRAVADAVQATVNRSQDVIRDEDLQLTLFCLYELAYGGIEGAPELEWDPVLLGARAEVEAAFEAALRSVVPLPPLPEPTSDAVAAALFDLTAPDTGPSLSRYVAKQATDEQLREFLVQRSIYTLKEADPHSWAIPRLRGRA